MKKVKEIIKKMAITSCVIYFIASIFGNIAFYSTLYGEFQSIYTDENKLIETYKDTEKELEQQLEDYKQEKGEDYPVIAILQYTQYMLGVEVIITIQLRLAIYSVGFGIIVVAVKEIFVQIKTYIKTKKDVKKNG